jgi:hypothetical protein
LTFEHQHPGAQFRSAYAPYQGSHWVVPASLRPRDFFCLEILTGRVGRLTWENWTVLVVSGIVWRGYWWGKLKKG